MSYATADFSSTGFRFDTKLWFKEPQDPKGGTCIGAVVGLNPGSSTADETREGFATVDKTMNAILNAYSSAAEDLGLSLPNDAYVRMWNICYTTEKDSSKVIAKLCGEKESSSLISKTNIDKTESQLVPGIWFAWTYNTPGHVARQRTSQWMISEIPVFYLGPDGLPHEFTDNDFSSVRHPSRKSAETLMAVARELLKKSNC